MAIDFLIEFKYSHCIHDCLHCSPSSSSSERIDRCDHKFRLFISLGVFICNWNVSERNEPIYVVFIYETGLESGGRRVRLSQTRN